MAQKKVFALLVGINDYRLPVRKLSGCVPDMLAVESYLQQLSDIDEKIEILKDKDATKSRIVQAFQEHLGQAAAGDTAFFYFSGHGAREAAHEVFWPSEPSHALQSLVTYDGVVQEDSKITYHLLADKELRWLIHQVAARGAHVLTIFDCCHSGQNTRSSSTATARRFEDHNLGAILPQRPWQDFIFSNKISPEQLKEQSLPVLMPEGRHLQIAACAPDELAYEVNGHGIFTQNLLDVLRRSDSNITYYDLQSRIRQYLKNNFKQTPNIYPAKEAQDEVFHFFLDRAATQGAPLYGNVYFKENEGWQIDLGLIHGISKEAKEIKLESISGQAAGIAQILEVKITESAIQPPPGLNPADLYRGYFSGLLAAPLGIYTDDSQAPAGALQLLEQRWAEGGRTLQRAKSEDQATYTVSIKQNEFVITRPNDPARPVIAPVKGINSDNAGRVIYYLGHIAQWEFIKNLHNPNTWLFKSHPVQIAIFQVYPDGREVLLPLQNDEIKALFTHQQNGLPAGRVKIRLTNTYTQKLHIALLYMSMNFEVLTELIPVGVVPLDPGQEYWILDGQAIDLSYEPEVEQLKYPSSITYLKIIAGTLYFDVNRYKLPALPSPIEADDRRFSTTRAGRNSPNTADDWITRLITLSIPNPKL